MGIAVVVDETVQHPLLSVVGTDLDPIHDRFGLMTQHLAVDAGVGKAHVRWQGFALCHQGGDLSLKVSTLFHLVTLCDLKPLRAVPLLSGPPGMNVGDFRGLLA